MRACSLRRALSAMTASVSHAPAIRSDKLRIRCSDSSLFLASGNSGHDTSASLKPYALSAAALSDHSLHSSMLAHASMAFRAAMYVAASPEDGPHSCRAGSRVLG